MFKSNYSTLFFRNELNSFESNINQIRGYNYFIQKLLRLDLIHAGKNSPNNNWG